MFIPLFPSQIREDPAEAVTACQPRSPILVDPQHRQFRRARDAEPNFAVYLDFMTLLTRFQTLKLADPVRVELRAAALIAMLQKTQNNTS